MYLVCRLLLEKKTAGSAQHAPSVIDGLVLCFYTPHRLLLHSTLFPYTTLFRSCTTLAQANRFLREHYLTEFNRRFRVAAAQRGSAFVPCPQRDLERVFSLQFERTVNRDNTVSFLNLRLQIEPVPWRGSLAGCSVTAHQHLDGTLSLSYGPHGVGRYDAAGMPLAAKASTQLGRGRGTAPFPCNPIPKTNPAHLARAQL